LSILNEALRNKTSKNLEKKKIKKEQTKLTLLKEKLALASFVSYILT
jgi:hypothetical protein